MDIDFSDATIVETGRIPETIKLERLLELLPVGAEVTLIKDADKIRTQVSTDDLKVFLENWDCRSNPESHPERQPCTR
jgi:hypothetical protein